ncbi:M48 family metalloprotease [Streptomyces sp. NPDC058157]|uniref:M48 family metalloprotease n=1 Tax=Streptomyces sp. NPDC058157 TaxID=3346360 RepID=UPI0036E83236
MTRPAESPGPPPEYPLYPQAPPPPPTRVPPQARPEHDRLDYRHPGGTRVHYRARQRTADAAALGRLALHLPGFLTSLLVVLGSAALLEAWLGLPAWAPTVLWLASGALTFHRPSERFLARHLLRLQHPLPSELAVLAPVWREVTARAGVDGNRYELWIEDSDELNALAAAGHVVAVTRRALERLPEAQLAAVLAHELGHHTAGHAWTGLLSWWYALPGRLAWRVLAAATVGTIRIASGFSLVAAGVLVILFGWISLATLTLTYGLPLLLLTLPYLSAAVGRRAELRADRHAAALGFAPMLSRMLHDVLAAEAPASDEGGVLSRLLSTHPDPRTRLHHLQRHMQLQA